MWYPERRTVRVLLPLAVIFSQNSFKPFDAGTIALILLAVVEWVVSVSLVVTVGAVAGVAFAHFTGGGATLPQPTESTSATESPASSETSSEHDDQHTQPMQ